MAESVSPSASRSVPTARPSGRSSTGWFERNAHLVMPLPAVVAVLGMLAFPLLYTLYMSFQDWTISSANPPVFAGIDNYVRLFTADPRFLNSIWVTFYYTAFGVTVQTFLGVSMALLFNRQFWGRGILRALAILPMVATPVAISLIFVMMYHPQLGILNYILKQVGLAPWTWTYASSTVIPALVIVDTWQWTPLIMLICLAGLAGLPQDPYESAMIDGASRVQLLWYITLPLLRPSIVTAVLFRLIDSLKSFDVIFVMTQGGPGTSSDTINLYLFNTAFSYFKMGQASSMVVVFFAIILGMSVVVAPDPEGVVDLSPVKLRRGVEEAGFFALIMLFMIPMMFVFYWMISVSFRTNVEATAPILVPSNPTLDGYRYVFSNPSNPFFKYIVNSTIVATGCTVIAMLLGVPAAFSIARWKQTGLALGILLARITPGLSFLVPWFITFRWFGMLDTHAALIISHLVVGLPIVVWVMIGFFEDVPRDLEDAALIDGCSIYGVLWRISIPLVKPGIVATAILSVIFSWNNFAFSVILAGPNTRTLPVAVFNLMSFEQFNWGSLAAAATVITLPVLVMAMVMQRHIVSGLTFGAVKQ